MGSDTMATPASATRSMVRAQILVRRERQRAAVAGDDAALEAVAQRRHCDPLQAARIGRAAFVHMQIEVETMGDRHGEQPVERELELGSGRFAQERNAAQNAAMPGDRLRDGAELRLVIDCDIDGKDRDGLERNAVLPLLAQSRRRPARRSRSAFPMS